MWIFCILFKYAISCIDFFHFEFKMKTNKNAQFHRYWQLNKCKKFFSEFFSLNHHWLLMLDVIKKSQKSINCHSTLFFLLIHCQSCHKLWWQNKSTSITLWFQKRWNSQILLFVTSLFWKKHWIEQTTNFETSKFIHNFSLWSRNKIWKFSISKITKRKKKNVRWKQRLISHNNESIFFTKYFSIIFQTIIKQMFSHFKNYIHIKKKFKSKRSKSSFISSFFQSSSIAQMSIQ